MVLKMVKLLNLTVALFLSIFSKLINEQLKKGAENWVFR